MNRFYLWRTPSRNIFGLPAYCTTITACIRRRPFYPQCPTATRCARIRADRRLQGFQGIRTRVEIGGSRFKPSRYLPLCLGKGFFTISLFTTPSDATFNLADVEIIVRGESRFKVNVHVEYDL